MYGIQKRHAFSVVAKTALVHSREPLPPSLAWASSDGILVKGGTK